MEAAFNEAELTLSRGEVPENRMGMGIDEAGTDCHPVGVDRLVTLEIPGALDRLYFTLFYYNRKRSFLDRIFDIPGKYSADIVHHCFHSRTPYLNIEVEKIKMRR
ncbi:MAG: hypothetical protein A4E57_02997 [Syntrophorhabdaceae bacterium PtaU1.Bin034]|nr:MAG: hypothetical protein A4E57_02997 [Syntrophorhabdaceae bacterium PtaU1.Bin034]